MSAAAKILIVEDEESLSHMLNCTLVQAGYDVTSARTGIDAMQHMIREEFSVVLLDLGLPDMDGKDVIAEARAISRAPFLVISARGSETEKIAALDMGANDYVAKPFDMGELLARIRVALRPACPRPQETAGAAGLVIDFATRRAIIGNDSVSLSKKEIQLLQMLADAKGGIVSHDQIIAEIWGRGTEADYMNVRVLAWQVRRKIEPDASAPRFLIAEAREGYRLKLD